MQSRLGLSRTQLWLILFLAIVLVVLAFFQSQPKTIEPYDPNDSSSYGLRALVLWLDELGYPVTISRDDPVPARTDALFWVHSGRASLAGFDDDESLDALYWWVERGGTLVLVGPAIPYSPISARFGVAQVDTFTDVVADIRQVQPLLPDIPVKWDDFASSLSLDFFETRAYVPILAHTSGAPVVAVQYIGNGIVWHLTEDFALTNLNLRDDRIATLLTAILRTVPAGAPVAFSTNHLSSFNPTDDEIGEISTLQDWLYTTPFGQATLLIMIALFAYIFLQGRRLGPALPGLTATRPREAAEYVTALAGLQRRMRQPNVVADHHRQRLKNAIGRLAQTPADLPDAEWLAQLHRADALAPTMLNQVSELLSGYAKVDAKTATKSINESDLIQLVQATDALLASLPRANMQLVR